MPGFVFLNQAKFKFFLVKTHEQQLQHIDQEAGCFYQKVL